MARFDPLPVAQSLRKLGLTANVMVNAAATLSIVALCALFTPQQVHARDTSRLADVVSLGSLPAEAQKTEQLIRAGGPFPYSKDGSVFGNRERALPRQARGYYREYTVRTPGSRDRGARRIVCGGSPPTRPEACYYTDDHYASFRRIAP